MVAVRKDFQGAGEGVGVAVWACLNLPNRKLKAATLCLPTYQLFVRISTDQAGQRHIILILCQIPGYPPRWLRNSTVRPTRNSRLRTVIERFRSGARIKIIRASPHGSPNKAPRKANMRK